MQIFFWKWVLSDNSFYFFFLFWPSRFVFLDVLSLLHFVPNRNLAAPFSPWFFCDILILFVSYWGLMEATFSSWILLSELSSAHTLLKELSGTHILKASNLIHKDSCIHYMQTLVLGENVVRQLCSLFWFFWLARFVSLDVLNPCFFVPYRNLAVPFSPLGVFFVISWFSLSVTGVLWRPRSHRGSCQVG